MKSALASSELRAMFEVAHSYARGIASIQELNGAVSSARTWARASSLDAAVLVLLDEWSCMVNRRWNEWELEKLPIPEHEFQVMSQSVV